MKILLLLLLVSCSSVSQKEPWSKGDCAEYQERKSYFRIIDEPEYTRSTNPNKSHEWFYKFQLIKKTSLPRKIFKRIDCDSIPKE